MQLQMKIPNTHSLSLQSVCWAIRASLRNTKLNKKYKNTNKKLPLIAVGGLRPPGLAASLPVRVSLRPLSRCEGEQTTNSNTKTNTMTNMNTKTKYKTCCAGWQEWPTGCAPVHQQQGQQWQEPGEEGDFSYFCHLSGQEHVGKSTIFLLTVGCPQVLQIPNS